MDNHEVHADDWQGCIFVLPIAMWWFVGVVGIMETNHANGNCPTILDMFETFQDWEHRSLRSARWLSQHLDLSPRARAILFDWMTEVNRGREKIV